ncbi:MAG: hypothetical protein ACE5E8_06045 [Acidimicrobiia bacterium]
MTASTKRRLGWAGLVVGLLVFTFGFVAVHFTGLPEQDSLGVDIYPGIPRGWQVVLIGQLIAFTGSQFAIAAVVVGWLWERKMTWARATLGALIFALESTIIFGIVPNEWLNLTQGTLEFTGQRIAFSLPGWLVLNNDVAISFATIKDVVHAGWDTLWFTGMLVGIYQWQVRQQRPSIRPQPLSTYGRPVVKGER